MAATVVVSAACSKTEAPKSTNEVKTISVKMAELQNDDETKTELAPLDGIYKKLVWSATDKIYVSTTGEITAKGGQSFTYSTYTLYSGSGTTEATFTGLSPAGTGKYVAVYTGACDYDVLNEVILFTKNDTYFQAAIPVNQTYVENGIAQYAMPMYACGADLDNLSFKLMGNVLRFNLYNGDGGKVIKIKSIKLTAGGEMKSRGIAGPFAIEVAELESGIDNVFGIWNVNGTSAKGSDHVNYSCGDGVLLSTDPGKPTAFNVVISRTRPTNEEPITARFTYNVDGGADTYKDIVLTNLNQTKRLALGKIYTFTPAQNVASW